MKIIDPHLHLFNLEQGDYHWLKAENPPFWPDKSLIRKTFSENDLSLDSPLELASFVHIEAGYNNGQPWQELVALEQTCCKPFRAIAGTDLTVSTQAFSQHLAKLAALNSFIGVRQILDEQALGLLTNKQVQHNFNTLNDFAKRASGGLVFETQLPLGDAKTLNALSHVIANNPQINFIINHAGFPPLDIHSVSRKRWRNTLIKLAEFPHVAIKCSGWEMSTRNYQATWLNENLTAIFTIFGAKKMMLASNFPLCLLNKKSYQEYWLSVITSDFFQALTKHEKSALCYDNALQWYAINL